jgi:hypothetical protein
VLDAAEVAYEHVEAKAALDRAASLEVENRTLRSLIIERAT